MKGDVEMKNKKFKKRIASFITAVVMLSGMLPLEYARDINFPHISLPQFDFPKLAVNAEDKFVAVNGWVTITTAESFKAYCNNYQNDGIFAGNHQNDNINLTLEEDEVSIRGTFPADMVGLGTLNKPFNGSIMIPDNGREGDITFSMNGPMFNYVYNSVKLISSGENNPETTVVFNRIDNVATGTSKPLLAQYVMPNIDNKAPANWKVRLSENNQYTYSGVIGEICENAQVNLEFDNQSGNDVINNTDAGIICGKMVAGSSLNLTYTESEAERTITSESGNAGGLVGTMEGNATLTIDEMPTTSRNIIASNGYAGGLVGKMTSDSSITVTAEGAIPINSGIVSSALGAGGFCGYYINNKDNSFYLSKYNINATSVYGQYCGGVFGVLENNKGENDNSITYTISNTPENESLNVISGSDTTYATNGYFGGVIGKYTTDNLENSLILDNLSIKAESQASFNSFGGAIGLVDSTAYIKAENVNVTATGTDKRTNINNSDCPNYAYFGGLVGATAKENNESSNGVLIDLGDFTLNANEFCGGGVVGQFYNGVLRLSGTTDMTDAKPAGGYDTDNNKTMRFASYGQLVGTNNNVLVYALGNGNDDGWTFKRSIDAVSDDLGTWGEVVRIPNVERDVLMYNETEHTVTVKSAVSSIESNADFVKTAINIQLNQGSEYDCLLFEDTVNSKRDTLLESTITLTADIDLSGTGVNGFMRDGCIVNASNDNKPVSQITKDNIGDVGSFTGTLNGDNHTVTLAIGESYGEYDSSQTEGIGQIYRHQYNGLFSVVGNDTDDTEINNLAIAGTINVCNAGPDGMFIGGIGARSHGSVTLNSITANEAIKYHEGANAPADTNKNLGKNIGGFIGYVSGSGTTIAVTGTSEASPVITLSGYHQGWNVYGGAIGKVISDSFTINIAQAESDSLKVKMTSDVSKVTNVGSNSDCGGLIGYIISNGKYKSRNVNIDNLVFEDCVVANASSLNGGGFLGFSWLNTNVKIDGVEVVGNSKIENTSIGNSKSNHVGIMCYSATGKWTVDSLIISSMTVNNGASSSLGIIVNKAYEGNNGLYLDVLNSGYTLIEENITLPATISIFDEIAAYSASDVIKGISTYNKDKGTGVISIDMNSNRSGTAVKITDTGTYQNRITGKYGNYANPNSRYYYNLNHIDIANGGQNLLKWSVNKYASGNISGEFATTGDPLGTTESETSANLTGLSFYPVPDAGYSTIGNLNVTFDYEAINTLEASNGSDSYARDPSAQNQHYLMQSGLFLNLTEGTTLTINGNLKLNGNFLSVGNYKGVLISDTMKGNLDCSNGSILLKGIKPNDKTSYLLINNITRDNTSSSPLSMKLSNVSTGEGYTINEKTVTVAKSLIGAVSGPGLSIEFSKIKLDARKSNDSISGAKTDQIFALDTAYNTKNSIFTDSTLIESILSDDTSVLVYNYTFDDDWGTGTPRNVTYGKEITDSSEYEGKEKRYYGDDKRWHTNPLTAPNANSEEFAFSEGFLAYVNHDYNATKNEYNLYYRELKVNVMTVALNVGCGTYNDPYIITDGEQLEAVAKFINQGSTSDLSKVKLPKDSSVFDTLSKNTTGGRWCSDKDSNEFHAIYIPNSNATGYVSSDTSDTEAKTWTSQNVQYYLANAYYKINADIEVKNFPGLGGTAANTAFRGVIVGEKNEDGTPKYTITNSSDYPFINVSNGCVVKDINIAVDKDISLSQTNKGSDKAAFGYVSKCSYYGGMIGEIMGGDNIIDNCYVTFEDGKKVTLDGTYGMLCPVGSYVGVVVFGAIIFKNMDADKANTNASTLKVYYGTNTTNLTAEDSKGAIYVNPLVGRVINGYAVNETTKFSVTENNKYHNDEGTYRAGIRHSLKNTTKHYTIADINKDETDKLDVSAVPSGTGTNQDGTINIPNSQALFVLSLITQSLAGTANTADGNYSNSLSYGTNTTVYGMSHGADYKNVGTATDRTDSDYVLASSDTAANTAVPYIISRYTKTSNGYTARCVTKSNNDTANCYYDINLKEGISYQLPDSFRGLGSVGKNNLRYNLKVDVLDGKGCSIDEDIYLNRFYNKSDERVDNYFDSTHNVISQQYNTNNTDFEAGKGVNNHGIGLFDSIFMKNGNSKLYNFNLSGSVNTEHYLLSTTSAGEELKGIADKKKNHWLVTGGVCGWSPKDNWCTFEKINLNTLTVSGSTQSAGLLAASGLTDDTTRQIVVNECNADEISIEVTCGYNDSDARCAAGGFIGKIDQGKAKIDGGQNGSFVKIKSIKTFDNIKCVAGGIVAYAGNGCDCRNMTVCPADSLGKNASVDIGAPNNRMAGGIVALMQPAKRYEPTCVASFENCKIERINIYANYYAGGLYGGTWNKAGQDGWITNKVTVKNCSVIGNADKKNVIKATNCAGGIMADGLVYSGDSPNIEIGGCIVSNYKIINTSNDTKIIAREKKEAVGVGGFIGFADAQKTGASATCYIYNSAINDCEITSEKGSAGGVIGQITKSDAHKILGYNIKLNNVTSESTNKGAWVGYMDTNDTATSIQFTGMAIYGNGFDKNIGNWSTDQNKSNPNTSFVFADYSGKCNENVSANSVKSGLNYSTDNHVDMPRYPYVNVYPQSAIGTGEIISGDGAVLYDTSSPVNSKATGSKTMAAKILNDISNSTISRRYTTFPDAVISDTNTIKYYLERSVDEDCNRISTYKTETGNLPEDVDDFAVIVISHSGQEEITNLIKSYIQLVTNTSTDYTQTSSYYEIKLNSCKYENGKFQIDDDVNTTVGLKEFNKNGSKYYDLDIDNADSLKQNTFTLVDVQFKDPLNTDKIAYHLYVPVYTVKQMTYTFKASAMTDTKSVAYPHESSSDYENSFGKFHIDSLNTWVTQYVRFTYSKQDMDNLLLTGNLDWNHEKHILLNTQAASERLPDGTNMILVDPNGLADKTYYGKINTSGFESTQYNSLDSWRIDLNKFTKNGKDNFKVCNFSELLASHITATQEDDGTYKDVTDEVNSNSAAPYSIYDSKNNKYYLYTSDGTGTYTLNVDNDINEDYYISIYVPKPETYNNELYFYSITSPDKLEGLRSAEISKGENENKFCNVMIADLFTQKENAFSVAPPNDTISTDNPTITVTASSTIYFSNKTVRNYLSNANLYHAFHLLLNRHEANGSVNNEIIGLNEDGITANYSINHTTPYSQCTIDLQSGYLEAKTENVMCYFSNLSKPIDEITVSAEIQMQFYDTEEFPENISQEDGIGVNVAASSNLAYEEERLSYTSMSAAFSSDTQYYHRESATAAHLSYSAVSELDEYDIQGKNSKNFSRLGINGYSSIGKYKGRTAMEIHSRAIFNAASVEDQYFNQATTVRFSMTLWKKTDTKAENGTITGVTYEQVNDISKYLLGVEFMNINTNILQNNVKSDSKTYVYDLAIEGSNELGPRIYPADIVYYAITGEGFTEYANYKVQIQAELLNAEGKTIGNQPKDYIVYTNAKVFPTVIGQYE